jgi:hypothetical protein
MLIIFGWRTTLAHVATLLVQCSHCQTPAAHHVRKLRRWFTLFFIPLIPYKTVHYTTCTYCGVELVISGEEAQRLAAAAQPEVPSAPAVEPPAPQQDQAAPPAAWPPQPPQVPQPQVPQPWAQQPSGMPSGMPSQWAPPGEDPYGRN